MVRRTVLAGFLLAATWIGWGLSVDLVQAATFHVDCSRTANGNGSKGSPLNSLAAASSKSLRPGDSLRFRRGTVCRGELVLRGRGSAKAPVVVGSYGTGAAARVSGTGTNAILAQDFSHLTIEQLRVSNPGDSAGDLEHLGSSGEVRNGIKVVALGQTVENVTIRDVVVQDVAGDLTKTEAGSAGIQVSAVGPEPIRFNGLRILGNTVKNVSRSGISLSGSNGRVLPPSGQPWPEASTGILVRGNRVDSMAGDGIVTRGSIGAVLEENVVSRGNKAGRPLVHPDGPMCNAGIWAFRTRDTLIQRNEVFGMEQNGCDGTGFDIDYRQDGTVVQHNYSHDNEGGFILLCSEETPRRAEVRFNLSVNDASTINHGPCGIQEGLIGDLSGISFYNNTIVAPSPNTSMQLVVTDQMYLPGDFRFFNNLVYATEPQSRPIACGDFCGHNLFFQLPGSGTDFLGLNPRLVDPTWTGNGRAAAGKAFRLRADSPARRAGIPVPESGLRDYFGNSVGKQAASIGFDQGDATRSVKPGCVRARKNLRQVKRKLRKARQARKRAKRATNRSFTRVDKKVKRLERKRRKAARRVGKTCRR